MRGRSIPVIGQEWLIGVYGDYLKGADALTGSYRSMREEYEAATKNLGKYDVYVSQRLALRGRG